MRISHVRRAGFVGAVLALSATSHALAVDVLNPDNGHYYRLVPFSATWEGARTYAMSQSLSGINGHLATITSDAEAAFVNSLTPAALWLGGIQSAGSADPSANWQWVTGEPFDYTNWSPFEPNDYDRDEFYLLMFADGTWNDQHGGGLPPYAFSFVIEFTPGYMPAMDGTDFLNWQRRLGRSGRYLEGDFNGDFRVNAADLERWKSIFGGGTVPEPSTILLSLLAGLAFIRRRA